MPDYQYLKATAPKAPPLGVDRERNVLRGYVLAQEGVFKDRRGEFDRAALAEVVRLGNATPSGLKSRLGHPTLSDDGVGKFLGRARDLRLGTAADARTGRPVAAVRGDLYFDRTALADPPGGGRPLGVYVMDLAESDPDAISSSLVLKVKETPKTDAKGRPLTDADGEPLPPVWLPTELHASDIVDVGDAVDGLLSAEDLTRALSVGLTPELQKVLRFDRVARLGAQLLDGLFAKAAREDVRARALAWLDRYLADRFGDEIPPATPRLDAARLRLDRAALAAREAAVLTPARRRG